MDVAGLPFRKWNETLDKRQHSRAFAHAKLLLFGEHAAVYGFPAIGLPLPSKLTITVSTYNDSLNEDSDWQYENVAPAHIPAVNELVKKLQILIPDFQTIKTGKMTIASDIIPGVGLGSSAALCVALVKAVVGLFPYLEVDPRQIWNWAHQCEYIFHGSPSGIDTGLAFHERFCAFQPINGNLPRFEYLNNLKLYLLIGVLQRNSNTKELITQLKDSMQHNDEIKKSIWKLGRLARVAIDQLTDNNRYLHKSIGELALEAHIHLSRLGLSTPEQDLIIEAGMKEGASGGKLSGAGGGGVFFLVAEDYNHLMNLKDRLNSFSELLPSHSKPLLKAVIWENECPRFV